jgi:hypothetical protein
MKGEYLGREKKKNNGSNSRGNPEARYYSGHVYCYGKDTHRQDEHWGF